MIARRREKNSALLIYSDLDGTLLDHDSYSFEKALPALAALKKKRVPLILCSSKTRAEIEAIRRQLKNNHPFVVENGGAIFIPQDYFIQDFAFDREDRGYQIIELGISYQKIRKVLYQIQTSFPAEITGFGDLSAEEVSRLCGLSSGQALLAKQREYDEPFLVEDTSLIDQIQAIAQESKLKIERGGRFFHLISDNDKGKAVSLLSDIYRKKDKTLKTVALGDSQNDLTMLTAVDYPVLVKKADGTYDPAVILDNLMLAPGIGPAGWNTAVLKLLGNLL